ncbi:phenylalanine--tRNA ligase subunit beta [Candidatus Haliotispira prima]|uniref:phenylalanine--tRNA ligase n=1 Tax=Candidatus Haliotispira prima TaxID=3034016 RepID=A0ABY8MJI5_9SPIO|nr:phenylalanine--tRNA ligase subunit beta [Candidatus Haliotispira prima]
MRIPLSWVDQFSPLPKLSVEEIGRRFTLGSCEVESILACIDPETAELWGQVQLAEILRIEKHPKAEKLSIVTIAVTDGQNSGIRLVCGADNLYLGMKTLWAPEGTEMRSGYSGQNFVLQNKEVMGVLSHGMLCSERELGLSDNHEGIIDLSRFWADNGAEKDRTQEDQRQENQQEFGQKTSLGMRFAEMLTHCLRPGQALRLNGREVSGIQFIFDVDNKSLTHRPDMWGVYGIAREFGTVFPHYDSPTDSPNQPGKLIPYGPSPFRCAYDEKWQSTQKMRAGTDSESPITLQIETDSNCQSYCALALDNIQIKESPEWLQQRLRLAGVNVINSIVDVSNYVMLELGMPNHIFDRDKLRGDKIRVYRLKENRSFQTLDEQQRQLQTGDTVVADQEGPQVIAGIMGGKNSSVSEDTRRILLECAVWGSHDIHKTSVRLGLRTDSSLRYEKSLDPYSIECSLWRLCQLICEIHPEARLCGGLQSHYKTTADNVNGDKTPQCREIETSAAQITRVLGYPLDSEAGERLICRILANLGFATETFVDRDMNRDMDRKLRKIRVRVPSYRSGKDISLEEDLIEEVGRIMGFDNIIPQAPLTEIRPTSLNRSRQLAREIRNFLVLNGCAQEILSYPLVGAKLLEQTHWYSQEGGQIGEELCLANPLNPEQDRMRPGLIPSHLELVARNAHNNRLRRFCIFELGRSYQSPASVQALQPQEQQHLLISSYSEKGNPLLELRNLCERLLGFLGLYTENAATDNSPDSGWQNNWTDWPSFLPTGWDGVHPHERSVWRSQMQSEMSAQTKQGSVRYPMLTHAWLFSVHPALLHEFKLKGKLALACIPLGPVTLPGDERPAPKKSPVQFLPLQRFPTVEFDCTVVLPPRVLAAEALEALHNYVRRSADNAEYGRMADLLQKVLVRSVYPTSKQDGSRWLTLQCIFADRNATLQSEEIKQLEDQTVQILNQAGFPLKMEHAD